VLPLHGRLPAQHVQLDQTPNRCASRGQSVTMWLACTQLGTRYNFVPGFVFTTIQLYVAIRLWFLIFGLYEMNWFKLENLYTLYSRDVHPVARVTKSQDKNPCSQHSVNVLYCVLSMITTCFGLRKRPSSGDYHVIQNIKKKITIRWNGSVESNSKIIG
jgi:hypothetical protein